MSGDTPSPVLRIFEVTSHIKAHELRATCISFLTIFVLMGSYFILRPVRDAMASDWSDTEVSFLWNIQFFVSAAIVSLYGLLISRLRFKWLVPLVYSIFAVSFVSFYLITPLFSNSLIEKTFYVWVSAFSLFHVSVFWSLMSDTFSKDQGKRLFPVIAAGASAGAIAGPMIPTFFAEHLGLDTLMLIAACGIVMVVPLVLYLHHLRYVDLGDHLDNGSIGTNLIGGDWWRGFRSVLSNRYLLGIGIFILLYVFISSFIYFGQKNVLADFSRVERTQILGSIDWVVNSLTFVLAFFVTGRIVTRLGMSVTLMLLPLLIVVGMLVLALAPLVVVVMAIQISRRAGNYAITRPAREMLFSQVSQEERFKAKPVIDIVIYRGGDAVSATVFAFLSEGLGLALGLIATLGAGVSALWAVVATRLGRTYETTKSPRLSEAAKDAFAARKH